MENCFSVIWWIIGGRGYRVRTKSVSMTDDTHDGREGDDDDDVSIRPLW